MRIPLRREFLWVTIFGITSGCAMFSADTGEKLPAGGFRGVASIRSNVVPLPAEVARDISALGEEEPAVVPEDAKAQPKAVATKAKAQPRSKNYLGSKHPLTGRTRFSRGMAGARGKTIKYIVRPGDTLMKIAFAKYGDVLRWRDIFEANRAQLSDFNQLEIGSILIVHGARFVVIERNGEPYLIRVGDTLSGISQKLYGTFAEWKALWRNNRQLIRDPNKIYAGFRIYYLPKSSRTPTSATSAPTDNDTSAR